MVYTVVNSFYCNMYDTNNYLVTATCIHGPWSEPIALNNFGFDPSLFHDDNGKKYMISMVTDHRVPKKYAGRLILQEYDAKEQKMIGPMIDIYKAEHIFLEGPHIFKRNGWYYLFSADTGTGEGHGQTIQRSRDIWGPYEMYQAEYMERKSDKEAWSILTTRHHSNLLLQKAGHCDLVETQKGEWYAFHLCGRASSKCNSEFDTRFPGARRYMIGRETSIQKMKWTEDDWLRLDSEGVVPHTMVESPDLPEHHFEQLSDIDHFDKENLNLEYQSLRIPMTDKYISLTQRKGFLQMYGRSGLASKFSQSLVAKRMTSYEMEATTRLEFEPEIFKQMAGLIFLYDTDNYIYLHISRDEELEKCITLLKAENKKYEYLSSYVPIEEGKPIQLKMKLQDTNLQCSYLISKLEEEKSTEDEWTEIGSWQDVSFLSDEACNEGWFTGAMFGLCCQDLTGFGLHADFDWFELKDLSVSFRD